MEAGQWNANNQAFRSFFLIQITTDPILSEDSIEGPKQRLLLLSNQISKNLVPAFCLKKSPNYSPIETNQPVIICFDILNKFENFQLPSWAHSEKWETQINEKISFEFLGDFQRAINLYMAYKMLNYHPIYFWSFLYLEMDDSPEGDVICQSIPIISNDAIFIRRFSTANLDSYLTKNSKLKPNSLILLPPYDHPFYVENCSGGKASLLSLDRKRISIPNQNVTFITLTKHPKSLFKLSPFIHPDTQPISTDTIQLSLPQKKNENHTNSFLKTGQGFSQMSFQTSFFGDIDEEIDDFYSKTLCNDSKEKKSHQQNTNPSHSSSVTNLNTFRDVISFGALTPSDLLSEMVSNKEERKCIQKILLQNPVFPEPPMNLRLSPIPFISTLSTDLGLPSAPKSHSLSFYHSSHISGQHTGIPDAIVNCRGKKLKIPANKALQSWQEAAFSPIHGPKNPLFRVFVIDNDVEKVKLFFRELESIYTTLGLGTLVPESDCFISVKESELENEIHKRYNDTQFLDNQPIVFIVHPFLFDLNIDEKVIITLVPQIVVTEHKIENIKNLALTVYTRLREMSPAPFGKLCFGPDEFSSLYFGFRFAPALVIDPPLSETEPGIKLHIAWDPETGLSAWSDDAGNCFHINREMDIDNLRQTIVKIRSELPSINVSLVISVLAEGIDEDQYNQFMQEEFADITDFTLVSVFPAPALQADFHQVFDDDIVVIAPNERLFDSPSKGYLPPLSSCFVIPHYLTAYQLSVFTHQKDDDQSALFDVARDFSFLSWTSACFSPEKRTSALPIHIRSLLRKSRKSTLSVARLEFLPSRFV